MERERIEALCDTDLTVEIPLWRYTQLIRTEVKMNMIEECLIEDKYPDRDIMRITGIQDEWNDAHKKESEEKE